VSRTGPSHRVVSVSATRERRLRDRLETIGSVGTSASGGLSGRNGRTRWSRRFRSAFARLRVADRARRASARQPSPEGWPAQPKLTEGSGRLEVSEGWRKRLGVEPAAITDSKGRTAFSNSAGPQIPALRCGEPPNCPQRISFLTAFLAGGGFRLHSPWPGVGPSRSCQRPISSNSHERREISRARATIRRGVMD
jgi:hypothetical protein